MCLNHWVKKHKVSLNEGHEVLYCFVEYYFKWPFIKDLEIATKLILHGILFIRAITWQLQDKISPKIWFDFGQRCSSFKWIWMLLEGLSTLPFTFLTILHSVVSTHSLYVATYFMKGFEFWHLWLLPMGEKHFGN